MNENSLIAFLAGVIESNDNEEVVLKRIYIIELTAKWNDSIPFVIAIKHV